MDRWAEGLPSSFLILDQSRFADMPPSPQFPMQFVQQHRIRRPDAHGGASSHHCGTTQCPEETKEGDVVELELHSYRAAQFS
jgi:hypothetical protein